MFLNSTLMDEYFRQFSGHTQVNAADLRSLRYPTRAQLEALGAQVSEAFPTQDEADGLIEEVLPAMDETGVALDAVRAKKKIDDAITILKELGLTTSSTTSVRR